MGSLSSFAADSSGALHEDPQINSYVRVERLDCKYYYSKRILAFFYHGSVQSMTISCRYGHATCPHNRTLGRGRRR